MNGDLRDFHLRKLREPHELALIARQHLCYRHAVADVAHPGIRSGIYQAALITIDLYGDSEDCEVQAGVAIPAEHTEAFVAEIERIAVEKFGGATFSELLDLDESDESMETSAKRSFADPGGCVIAAEERIIGEGR